MGAAGAAAAAAAGPPVVGVAVADPAAAAEEFEEESFLGAAGVAAGAEDCAGVEAADAVLKDSHAKCSEAFDIEYVLCTQHTK